MGGDSPWFSSELGMTNFVCFRMMGRNRRLYRPLWEDGFWDIGVRRS